MKDLRRIVAFFLPLIALLACVPMLSALAHSPELTPALESRAARSNSPTARPHSPNPGRASKLSIDRHLALQTPAPSGRIVVKFAASTGVRMKEEGPEAAAPQLERVRGLLDRLRAAHGDVRLQRHFSRSADDLDAERQEAERRSGRALPDLNRYAQIVPSRSLSRAELLDMVAELSADPAVEAAFLEPVAVPAALGFDAFTGRYDPHAAAEEMRAHAIVQAPSLDARVRTLGREAAIPAGALLPTPSFVDQQGYLDPAPLGVDAEGVWTIAGGRGQTVKLIDIEGAWLWDHEDLVTPFFTAGGEMTDASWRNHGTAVMGEIRGTSNSYGVSGIANLAQIGGVSIAELSVADAINTASAQLAPGDIFVIELHAPGPNATGEGQFGYVCMEFWLDNFEAIQIATANGRICCEAAGNGSQNYDDPVYGSLFDREARDSGAILCGASDGSSLEPAGFTNYGARVDLHGWGYNVVTCGYGNLQDGDETEWYTDTFSGTSSATPIVAGSVASLQGMVKAAFGIPLDAHLAREILVETGTPQTGTAHIGPRPHLTAAWAEAQSGIGRVAGTVTAQGTGQPLAGIDVRIPETGAYAVTASNGDYAIPLRADSYTLEFDSFLYEEMSLPIEIAGGQTTTQDAALALRPTVEIGGSVISDDGVTPLPGVRVAPQGVPIGATSTDLQGDWAIDGFPMGHTYAFLFDGRPGHGAEFASVAVERPARFDYGIFLQLPAVTADFESGANGFTGDPIWSRGTPVGADGPTGGFSGARCWGVGMNGDYDDDVSGYLTSPSYDFSGVQELKLSFHYWCETEADYDGAAVDVWDASTSAWVPIVPLPGYGSATLGGLDYRDGWSGSTGGWVGTVFDLTPYISSHLSFRVLFGSDQGVNGPGFWIDDIAFDTGDAFSGVGPREGDLAIALFTRGPNPFAGSTRIALALPGSEEVDVAVFDAAGRRVRTLASGRVDAGVTELAWDGRDDRGDDLGSGIYFVRLDARGQAFTRRVVLAK